MKTKGQRLLLWVPRILAIVFALFLGLFSLDVFGEGYGFWGTILAFLIHNIPSLLLAVGIVLAWKRPWVGTVVFILTTIVYLILTRLRLHWSSYVTIALPMVGLAGLYWWSWRSLKNHSTTQDEQQ